MLGVLLWADEISLQDSLIVAVTIFSLLASTSTLVGVWWAKRSNWRDGLITTRVACRRAGYLYGTFIGVILGTHYWGSVGAAALGIAFFIVGRYVGNQIGSFVWARIKSSTPLDD
jgi:LytS/YehU family sensor histidine kinase